MLKQNADETDSLKRRRGICTDFLLFIFFLNLDLFAFFVISTKEKSPREARQRLAYWTGVTCGDFSFVEMTRLCVSNIARGFNRGNTMHLFHFSLSYGFTAGTPA